MYPLPEVGDWRLINQVHVPESEKDGLCCIDVYIK